ncbi:pseudaminic acid cytidylyltransferase [Roseibaca sp. V10]|uniref:Pseudaminic acid cytidylyltransferase n=1 Tax=Roseinatronobacter domitianus TaxID=2940293 RepID=A0ABT0M5B6_9RHOB|nr:pseudaminic acid cytidylyltransferase [Roseibaca domitiana]MCL1630051.1 pseudaminic acid cytidylyltransferase [Roseibaca domitiana]
MSVCIIPARGGSKRIWRKNIRPFLGKPMIAWSITAAHSTGCFDRIVVSTEDDEIAAVAEAHGAEVPFRRDPSLADDLTGTLPVIAHAVRALGLSDDMPVCCLYATAPFVRAEDLRAGQAQLAETGAAFVVSVTSYAFPIQRALLRDADGAVQMIDPAQMHTRSQDLPEAWHDAGQFYWAKAATWASARGVFEVGAQGLPLPRHRVQDIDMPEDWTRAEWMMRALQAEDRA